MAKSRRKNGSATRGRFRLKKMGKGWSTARKQRTPERVILRITDPEPAATGGKPEQGKGKKP